MLEALWLQKGLHPGAKNCHGYSIQSFAYYNLSDICYLIASSSCTLFYQLSAYRPRVRNRTFLGLTIARPTKAHIHLSLNHDVLGLSHHLSPEAKLNLVCLDRGKSIFALVIGAVVFRRKRTGCGTHRCFPLKCA